MLKKYKELKVFKEKIEEVGRMLKALMKFLEEKHLNPWALESSNPCF